MSQRTVAHIGIWVMILLGLFFTISVFVVPYFAESIAEMDTKLHFSVQYILNLSAFMSHYGWSFVPIYAVIFVAIIIWHTKAKHPAASP